MLNTSDVQISVNSRKSQIFEKIKAEHRVDMKRFTSRYLSH